MDDFLNSLIPFRDAIDQALSEYSAENSECPQRLSNAIRYSLLAPGKRLRPLLSLLAAQAVGGSWRAAIPAACAVEMINAYSLIHDDLPAMDNDDLRRGRPTCHRQFDEATAILAGDALQALAFEVLATKLSEPSIALECCRRLSFAAGRSQLVGGQADDLAAEGRYDSAPNSLTTDEQLAFLQRIHRRKTGAMITVALELGGIAVGCTANRLELLTNYGQALGLAFQIVDDCLDVESTSESMGKRTGKDSSLGKLTYPGLLGVEESRRWAERCINNAISAVTAFGHNGEPLTTLARYVLERKN